MNWLREETIIPNFKCNAGADQADKHRKETGHTIEVLGKRWIKETIDDIFFNYHYHYRCKQCDFTSNDWKQNRTF